MSTSLEVKDLLNRCSWPRFKAATLLCKGEKGHTFSPNPFLHDIIFYVVSF